MGVDSITLSVDGQEYPAELALPAEDTTQAVLLIPGAIHGPYGDVFNHLAEALTDAGIALLRYQTWGEDEELDNLDTKSENELLAEYKAAVGLLVDHGYDRVSVVGKSLGGRIALLDPVAEVDRLVLWAPAAFIDGGDTIESLDVPEDVSPPLINQARLADHDVPVDILQGDEDNIPVGNAQELADELPDARAHVIEGADHSFVGGDPEVKTIERTVALLTSAVE